MARELECSVDYLVNDAMKQYARQRGYGGGSVALPATRSMQPGGSAPHASSAPNVSAPLAPPVPVPAAVAPPPPPAVGYAGYSAAPPVPAFGGAPPPPPPPAYLSQGAAGLGAAVSQSAAVTQPAHVSTQFCASSPARAPGHQLRWRSCRSTSASIRSAATTAGLCARTQLRCTGRSRTGTTAQSCAPTSRHVRLLRR